MNKGDLIFRHPGSGLTGWLAASLAGFLYSAVTIRTGWLSEAIAAHATTNALIAVPVPAFHQWQLWQG